MTFDGTCERGGVQRAPQEIEERSPGAQTGALGCKRRDVRSAPWNLELGREGVFFGLEAVFTAKKKQGGRR
jgi:hypothetical protein